MTRPIRFGTDGVRGPAGEWPLDEAGARQIGFGISKWTEQGCIHIGRDTRTSGPRLEAAIVEGLLAGGSTVKLLGIVPTAAVSASVAHDQTARAGIMITASHNAWPDNGIKVVDTNGHKLIDPSPLVVHFAPPTGPGTGTASTHPGPLEAWKSALPDVDLGGKRVLLDAAHGASSIAAAVAIPDMTGMDHVNGCTPNFR